MTKKILIVDDSVTILEQVSTTLAQAGYEVLEAENGEIAIRHIEATPDIALIICDISMPVMDGITMVMQINERKLVSCPILMLTSEGQPDLVARAKELGVKGWMVKPVSSEMLVKTVEKLTA